VTSSSRLLLLGLERPKCFAMHSVLWTGVIQRPLGVSNAGSRRLSESIQAAAVGAMAERYFENTLQPPATNDPLVAREILKAAAVALKVSRAGQLDSRTPGLWIRSRCSTSRAAW
jgi:hypothetical protein